MQDNLRVLVAAQHLIADVGWTQEVYARDRDGRSVDSSDAAATHFCAIGAVRRACYDRKDHDWEKTVRDCEELLNSAASGNAMALNDRSGTTRADVIKMFDRAIAECSAE